MLALLVLTCLASALAEDLSAVADVNGVKFWRDRGGTGGKDVTVYEPTRSGSTFYILGQRAQGNYNKMSSALHAYRDDSSRRDALARPSSFQFIWDDRGSTYYDDASVWRPQCPSGYVALGDVLTRKNRVSQPPSDIYDKFRCVNRSLVEECYIGSKIWDNAGTWGKYYISMWTVDAKRGQFNSGFFYAKNQHNERPDTKSYCLRASAVKEL